MSQFTVYRNTNSDTKAAIPFLLNIQSDLIEDLGTRVVAPLYLAALMNGKTIRTLMPTFEIDGVQYLMMTPQLAGISKKLLGASVADLSAKRDEILMALDLLITGI